MQKQNLQQKQGISIEPTPTICKTDNRMYIESTSLQTNSKTFSELRNKLNGIQTEADKWFLAHQFP